MEITRRTFSTMAGTALAGAGIAAAMPLPAKADEADELEGYRAADYAHDVTETVECDIVIVGSGASGMVAAVESAQQGKNTLVLESQATRGGNGNFTDCCFSFGSPEMQKGCEKYGVTVLPSEIIRSEVELYDYMVNPLLWADTIEHSADNTKWLQDAGVKFAETTDYYAGTMGKTPTALMWADGYYGGGETMMKPLFATAEGLGVEFRCETRARALKTDESGAVCGLYATTADGVLEVNAHAVILAGGGWAANPDLLAEYGGYDLSITTIGSAPGPVGDTLKMAVAVGAREDAKMRGYMFGNKVEGLSSFTLPNYAPGVWVNEDGDRFANEDCGHVCHDYTGTAVRAQKRVYVILSDAMVDDVESQGSDGLRSEIEAALEEGSEAVFRGDDAADLAAQVGWSGDFEAALAAYEGYVETGVDEMFGKDPQYLVSLGDGPLYALLIHQEIALSLGGINTNRNWQVVDETKQAIPGLYAIGADGQMVYLGLYNLNTSGGHMATNVEGGRYAVKHAVEHCF